MRLQRRYISRKDNKLKTMSRKVKSGLIQMSLPMTEGEGTIKEIMDAMYDKHIPYIEEAGKQGVQILCLQEIFNTPLIIF